MAAKKKTKKKTRLLTAQPSRPRKQSSPRVSSIAAKWLRRCRLESGIVPPGVRISLYVPLNEIKALAASVLSQDEKRGR